MCQLCVHGCVRVTVVPGFFPCVQPFSHTKVQLRAGGFMLTGAVCRTWWASFVEAQRIWHAAVVGARWRAVRDVFGAYSTTKVALNAKAELKQLRVFGVEVAGEVLDPQVSMPLIGPHVCVKQQ